MMKCRKWNRRITQQSHVQVGTTWIFNKIVIKSKMSRAWGDCLKKKNQLGERSEGPTHPPTHPNRFAIRILYFRARCLSFARQFFPILAMPWASFRPGGRGYSSGGRTALFGGLFAETNILPAVLRDSQGQGLQATWNQSLKTWPKNKRRFVSFSRVFPTCIIRVLPSVKYKHAYTLWRY